MDLEREEPDAHTIRLQKGMVGDIQFQAVCFRYGSRTTVLENFNLTIQKGSLVALVGESGSGKSTVINILQNLYPIHSGRVRIGEYDLKYIEIGSLRNRVGVVPQKIDLFAGNVIENIAIGDDEPDMKKVISVSARLGILEFIEKLPGGFNAWLGENGATLSGGQKQRIAIARALYRDPDILILDEATSSLDSVSEGYVQQTVGLLRQEGKTIISIAHRLSTVCRADKIVVINDGKVAEEGTHEELLKNRGQYYQLLRDQFSMSAAEGQH
jgi:ATP-binding cassette subfamily B protein